MLHGRIGVGSVFIAENPELTGFTGFLFLFSVILVAIVLARHQSNDRMYGHFTEVEKHH